MYARLRAYVGRPVLVLSDQHEADCDPRFSPGIDDSQVSIVLWLRPGPGEAIATRRAYGTMGEVRLPGGGAGGFSFMLGEARVTVEPGPLREGGHLRGELVIDGIGRGRFDASLCPGDWSDIAAGLDTTPPAQQLTVMLGGKPFAVASIIAHGGPLPERRMFSFGISLHERPATCDTAVERGILVGSLAIGPGREVIGTQQPVGGNYYASPAGPFQADGWVRWDEVSTTAGGPVRGVVFIKSPEGTPPDRSLLVSGPIATTMCPR
jgi:hypothetical protein